MNETQENKKYSRFAPASRALLFWTLFIGIGAVSGALGMLIDPSGKAMGMDAMLPYFKKLPFSDVLFTNFIFSGIALLIVNGLTNLTAAVLIIKKKKIGLVLGGIFGVTLMLWICIQFYMFPFNFMSTIYFIFGFLQTITGFMACIFKKQEDFKDEEDKLIESGAYSNIGSDSENLVVYFSRMGYVRKKAYQKANQTGADIYEIKSTEITEKTVGFWWCGRYGMHKWDMPIKDVTIDLSKYKHVTICSPVWVFNLAAPVRSFCKKASGKISSADYILTHFNNKPYFNVADEMDKLLGLHNTKVESYCVRYGKEINKKNRK